MDVLTVNFSDLNAQEGTMKFVSIVALFIWIIVHNYTFAIFFCILH